LFAGLMVFVVVVGPVAMAAQPAASQPATQPSGAAITARVTAVKGVVQAQSVGGEGWQRVKLDDVFGAGTRIRTMLRSSVVFVMSDTTVVKVEKATVMQITTAERTAEAENIRIGLEYGQVRAGVAERELRSDFTIDSPNATLARRGTQDLSIFSERLTQRWTVRLDGPGLALLQEISGASRTLYPSEYVTQLLTKMMVQKKLDWFVSVQPSEGLTPVELAISSDQGSSGLGVTDAAASAQVFTAVGTDLSAELAGLGDEAGLPFDFIVTGGELFNSAGNFGFGGTTPLSTLIKGQDPFRARTVLATRGARAVRVSRGSFGRSRAYRQIGRPRVSLR